MKITAPEILINPEVEVPFSKSISNRLLIMQFLGKGNVQNCSDAEDTKILERTLKNLTEIIDVGHAGTCYRFLTALLAITPGEYILTGSFRMKQRPIKPLVESLIHLGADIDYMGVHGFPPLKIVGGKLLGGTVEVDAGMSSQYVTALMLIAPYLDEGLDLVLTGEIVSQPYIHMTAALQRRAGVDLEISENRIKIPSCKYEFSSIGVELDWSSVAFWYELAYISESSSIFIPHLKPESIQGDSALVSIFSSLGVETTFNPKGANLKYVKKETPFIFEYDFTDVPDLVLPIAVALSAKGQLFKFTGIEHLRIKESDRIDSLITQIEKLGGEIEYSWNEIVLLKGVDPLTFGEVSVDTYEDHRMAMAFAPLAWLAPIDINTPEVVEKSYPSFWNELSKLGFSCKM